jgi:hypothetical protein
MHKRGVARGVASLFVGRARETETPPFGGSGQKQVRSNYRAVVRVKFFG